MAKLTGLPPEIRNSIYDLLIILDEPIPIASPRKEHVRKKQEHSSLASLLRVNKQINQEAKTLFYARSTFIVGNGSWGSTSQVNVQALKEFIRRVPKDCIALIHKIELDICLVRFYNRHRNFHRVRKEDISQLEMVSRALAKYFKGLESVSAAMVNIITYPHTDSRGWLEYPIHGNVGVLAKPIWKILTLPALKQLYFKYESSPDIKTLVEAVLEGNEEAKDKVKMMKQDGSIVPLLTVTP